VLNGALVSLFGLLWSLEIPSIAKVPCFILGVVVAIIANILFIFFMSRYKAMLTTLINRTVAIEKGLQERGLTLDTYTSSLALIKSGKTLNDSRGSQKSLRQWQKLDIFKLIYVLSMVTIFAWIMMIVIGLSAM
jgi:hypothetical protein